MNPISTTSFFLTLLAVLTYLFMLLHRPARQELLFPYRLPRHWLADVTAGWLIVFLPFLGWLVFSYTGSFVEFSFRNFQPVSLLKDTADTFLFAALEELLCRGILLSLLLYLTSTRST